MKVRCLVLLGFSLSKPCDPRLSRMPYGPIASAIMAAYEHDEELLQPLEVIDAIFRTAEGGQ